MTEIPFFFRRDQAVLFGMMHLPDGPVADTAYLMSHPFGEEKLWSHRVLLSFARSMVRRGHAVLRFDYAGAGDSSGEASHTSLATHYTDLAAAVGELRNRHPGVRRVGLAGLRLGATVAAVAMERARADGPDLLRDAPLILWDPVMDGDSYIQELLRTNLSTQLAVNGKVTENREVLTERILAGGTVNVEGYEIGKPFLDSFGVKDLLTAAPKTHDGPTLVVQISPTDSQKENEGLRLLGQSYANGTFARVTEQPFWREIKRYYGQAARLEQTTLDWLETIDA